MAETGLSVDGANRIAEMLHVNSALTSLDLACELIFNYDQISVNLFIAITLLRVH